MASFDFKEYLSGIDPTPSYTIIPLTGGSVNITVRAIKTSSTNTDAGKFPAHRSIILKHAPPYIAKLGEDAPFSQFRQTIEAHALNLFAPPSGELLPLCHLWNIEVPKLLHNDSEAHVLILTDLGELNDLTEQVRHMTPLGHTTYYGQEGYKELGCRLGGFLADLHSPDTFQIIGHKYLPWLYNPSVRGVFYDHLVMSTRCRLHDLGIPDAEELYNRISNDYLRPDEAWEREFILGDLWTGSILLDWPRVCMIDWEFAGVGRGVNGDMPMFLAHLHLRFLISPVGSPAWVAMDALIQNIVGGYRRQCAQRRKDNEIQTFKNIRSAFIVHGRKIVNNAVDRDWPCECCADAKVKKACRLVAKLVSRGLWYLRSAAVNIAEFREEANWTEVMKEEGRIILGLFMDFKFHDAN